MADFQWFWVWGSVTLGIILLVLHMEKSVKDRAQHHNKKEDGNYKLPPGSLGWPLIGETIQWYRCISKHHMRKFVDIRERRYGDMFTSHLFGRRVIFSLDPQFNRFILQNEGRLFRAQYEASFNTLMGKYGLFSVHGDLQRKLHGIIVNLLSSEKLRSHFMETTQILLQRTFDTWEDGTDILLQEECHQMILKLMLQELMDLSHSKEAEEFGRHFCDLSAGLLSVPIKIPGSAYAKGFKARAILERKIYSIIEDRTKHPEAVHNDFLNKLLNDPSLSDEMVVDVILFVLFAGHETSSRTMALSIKYLTDCPNALEELREEHDALQKTKDNQMLTWNDYQSMKFTQSVINETLRLANIVPAITRQAMEDIKVKGYVIPKGSIIKADVGGVHLDEKKYRAASQFDPWRWKCEENQNQEASMNAMFMPFGGGGRLCPGSHLARLEVALFLHHFVTKYRWTVTKADRISNFPFPHLAGGFPIRVHHRKY